MKRREFVTWLGGAVLARAVLESHAVRAQQDGRLRRVGLLINRAENDRPLQAILAALREGLAKQGWVEGRSLRLDVRWSGGDLDQLQAQARELVGLAPDVIVADAGAATRAARQVTKVIPIVYLGGADSVVTGLVQNIARPESNITGFSSQETPLASKWLELLKEAAPQVARVALVFNSESLSSLTVAAYMSVIQASAPTMGLQAVEMPIRDPIDIVRALDAFAGQPNGGMIVFPVTSVGANGVTLIRLALQHRLPAIYPGTSDVTAGGLMSYVADSVDQARRAATYVDRLLHGAKVSELPVQFPTKYELKINLKTAKAIGLTIPETFLLRADELIE